MIGSDGWPIDRRRLLAGAGSVLGLGSLRSSPYEDRDGDGIPDELERSESHHRFMEDVFGAEQFDALDPTRKDLLVDARYVGDTTVSDRTKRFLEDRFRTHGIHLQWLDYPQRYDEDQFIERYGQQVERILWPFGSFYADVVEDELHDIALQVVVVPSRGEELDSLYTIHRGDHYEGVSFGNRCLVTEQRDPAAEAILLMHEIGHLVLCHNDDPNSVMSPSPDTARFTETEWERLRGNLDNIRDSTGFDIAYRRCILSEYWNAFRGQ